MKKSQQYPKMVMVIRHGEKPGDPSNDSQGGPDLSPLGSARAAALPSLFTSDPQATPIVGMQQLSCDLSVARNGQFTGGYGSHNIPAGKARFPTPDFLFATKADPNSNRPVETIMPLQQALGCFENAEIPINSDFPGLDDGHNGVKGLKKEILNNPIYAGKVVLICWHHGKIPKLVEELGVDARQLPWPDWPADTFDLIFCITWENGQANLTVETQRLLHGDADNSPSFPAGSVTLVLDAPQAPMASTSLPPKNFRSMNCLSGSGRRASGSCQYSPKQLQDIISQGLVKLPLTVVDLRQESHGFISLKHPLPGEQETELAASWFAERDWSNVAKGLVSLEADEIMKLNTASQAPKLTIQVIVTKTPYEEGIDTATALQVHPSGSYMTEQALLNAHKVGYLRLPTTDHCRPRDSEVDRFVAFEANLTKDMWLHFHCRAGDGRTTTFMAMHDILHNAQSFSLDDILTRQGPAGIGVIDLRSVKTEDQFDHPFLVERLAFLTNFYKYVCNAKPDGFKLTWSNWVIQNTARATP